MSDTEPTGGRSEPARSILTRRRVVVAALVAAFIAVFAAIGAVSRSSPGAATTAATATGPGTAPSTSWYWTMAVSPTNPGDLVLGTAAGLYRSSDGGKTWQATGPKGVDATSLIDSGPLIVMGGGRSGRLPSPVVKVRSSRVAADGSPVLATSSDGGATWEVIHPHGLPDVTVQALAVDPTDSTVLYVLLNSGRLYRSTDGARSFQLVSPRLGVSPWALAITQGSHFVAGDMDSGSHLSANGKLWQTSGFTDANGGRMVMEYAVQPSDSAHLLMTSVGIEASTDGGKTWRVALKSPVMFGPVAWAPSAAGIAYAVDFDGSVWRTADGGQTWTKVS